MGDKDQKSLTIIVVCGLGILLFISILVSGGFALPEKSGGWFYAYQTLFGALVALTSVLFIGWQYLDTLHRRRLSERAKMNDALSELCRFAKNCFDAVLNDNATMLPNRQNNGIEVLKHAIEFLDTDTSEAVYELVITYQVNNSRLERYFDPSDPRAINSETINLYDAIKLYAMTISLFDYARKEDNKIRNKKNSQCHMFSALNAIYGHTKPLMAHNDPKMSDLIEHINELHPE